MASAVDSPPAHSPPAHHPQRPRGILKNSYQKSPPTSPNHDQPASDKELTIANTQINAGHRRSSSGARPSGSRRQSGANSSIGDVLEPSQRLKTKDSLCQTLRPRRRPVGRRRGSSGGRWCSS
ncbi:Glc8 protein [Fusarium fujikuroi]|nr:Glc8 protein [Fusarium fujikuroi]